MLRSQVQAPYLAEKKYVKFFTGSSLTTYISVLEEAGLNNFNLSIPTKLVGERSVTLFIRSLEVLRRP